jgi:hypothetical protein
MEHAMTNIPDEILHRLRCESGAAVTDAGPPALDWRVLSEQTDYRVLTFPSGETMDARDIASVRMGEAQDVWHGAGPWLRRCIVDARGTAERGVVLAHIICHEEPDAVFEVTTRAHRMHGGKS